MGAPRGSLDAAHADLNFCIFEEGVNLELKMDFLIPSFCWGENIEISADFFRWTIVEFRPFLDQQIHNFNKIGSRNPYRSIEHETIYNSGNVRASKSIRMSRTCPKHSRDFSRPYPTSPGPLHKPFKIKDLGLLTYISRKSASRRFSWCNSQLLTPSGRRAMKETVFVPYPTTPGKNRLT